MLQVRVGRQVQRVVFSGSCKTVDAGHVHITIWKALTGQNKLPRCRVEDHQPVVNNGRLLLPGNLKQCGQAVLMSNPTRVDTRVARAVAGGSVVGRTVRFFHLEDQVVDRHVESGCGVVGIRAVRIGDDFGTRQVEAASARSGFVAGIRVRGVGGDTIAILIGGRVRVGCGTGGQCQSWFDAAQGQQPDLIERIVNHEFTDGIFDFNSD